MTSRLLRRARSRHARPMVVGVARESPSHAAERGRVTLVGAGPGGADLITVRGANALRECDVVVFDRLVDPDVVDVAPCSATRVDVGKGKGFGPSQREICDVLVSHAARGRHVVRLKGGDPFVFGRGLEEVDAVTAAGFEVDVVPGVSSALGAPALAGISLTDRRIASSFTVLTGHRCHESDHDWTALAASGSTLVVLMAATTASEVAGRLVQEGRPACEPVAFVHAAGTSSQDVVRSDLADVVERGCPFPSPTVMVVGVVASEAASLIEQLPHHHDLMPLAI